jgi:hypothetical protein
MAGAQVTIMANQVEDQRLGFQAISLTHYDDTAEPQIAAGSVVEIGGALFEFAALESISGLSGIANNSDVYVKLTVSGSSVTASGVTTPAPTWDTAKQGWYSGAERYVFALRKDGSGNYTNKRLLQPEPARRLSPLDIIAPLVVATGATQMWAADAEAAITATPYTKEKEAWMPVSGVVSVYFELKSQAGGTAYGRIYINGTAVGTERTTTSLSYVPFTEDITIALGDKLQLYGKMDAGNGNMKNFRIRSNTAIIAGSLIALIPVTLLD